MENTLHYTHINKQLRILDARLRLVVLLAHFGIPGSCRYPKPSDLLEFGCLGLVQDELGNLLAFGVGTLLSSELLLGELDGTLFLGL